MNEARPSRVGRPVMDRVTAIIAEVIEYAQMDSYNDETGEALHIFPQGVAERIVSRLTAYGFRITDSV